MMVERAFINIGPGYTRALTKPEKTLQDFLVSIMFGQSLTYNF